MAEEMYYAMLKYATDACKRAEGKVIRRDFALVGSAYLLIVVCDQWMKEKKKNKELQKKIDERETCKKDSPYAAYYSKKD